MASLKEITLSNLIAARSAYLNYISQLEQVRQNTSPLRYLTLIGAQINYGLYQAYLAIARNGLAQTEDILKNDYGIEVNRYSFIYDDPNRNPLLDYTVQLSYIYTAVQNMAVTLKTFLIDSLEQCEQTAIENNQPFNLNIDDFRAWTPAQTFKAIFDAQGMIQIIFDTTKTWSMAITSPDPRIYLTNSSFINLDKNQLWSEATVREIISHEFGHIFANFLGISPNAWQMQTYPLNVSRQPSSLIVPAPGGPGGEPLVSEGYIQATNGYYAGNNVDFGDTWFNISTGYAVDDPKVTALTNLNYGVTEPCSGDCEEIEEYLVDRQMHCIENTNNGNRCIPFTPSAINPQIPGDELGLSNAVYARLAGTYIPEIPDQTTLGFFSNEAGVTTQNAAPKEGFADLFKVAMAKGIEVLPSGGARRVFFEQNIHKWLFQLLSDFISPDAVSICLE